MNAAGAITGCILAGGQGSRLGGIDKGLVDLAGRPLVAHVVERLAAQVERIVISANRNAERYREWADCVVNDELTGYAGPLAGIAAALGAVTTPFAVVVPCDSPLLPRDLVARLAGARLSAGADIAVACTGEWLQPVFALLTTRLAPDLIDFLAGGGRKIDAWYARHPCVRVDFGVDCAGFMNVNTPDELARAAAQLGQG